MRVRVCTGRPGAEPEGPPSTPQQWTFRGTFLFPPGELCLASGQIPLAAPVPRQAGERGLPAGSPAPPRRPLPAPRGHLTGVLPPLCCEWNVAGPPWGRPGMGWGRGLLAAPPLCSGTEACLAAWPATAQEGCPRRAGRWPRGASPACSPSPARPPAPWAALRAADAHPPLPQYSLPQDTQAGTVQRAGQDNRVPFVAGVRGCHWRPGVGGEGWRQGLCVGQLGGGSHGLR